MDSTKYWRIERGAGEGELLVVRGEEGDPVIVVKPSTQAGGPIVAKKYAHAIVSVLDRLAAGELIMVADDLLEELERRDRHE